MNTLLTTKKCVACKGDMPPLTKEEAEILLAQTPGWTVSDDVQSVRREIATKNFATALDLANKIGALAESEGHHPDLTVSWGKLDITLTTHAIHGLSENDFIMAAKINQLLP